MKNSKKRNATELALQRILKMSQRLKRYKNWLLLLTLRLGLVAWRSGNALCLINEVALHRARLVLG